MIRGTSVLDKACGCLAGQFCGDAFGAQFEFMSGPRVAEVTAADDAMKASGVWNTAAGQITDDSELALALIRSLKSSPEYNEKAAMREYVVWYQSHPFDIGGTTSQALSSSGKRKNAESQANGAMMRVSPLAVRYYRDPTQAGAMAFADAGLTHPSIICRQANQAFARGIAFAIKNDTSPEDICAVMLGDGTPETDYEASVKAAISDGMEKRPEGEMAQHTGFVLLALQNAVYQLTHANGVYEAIIDSVKQGGDTDTTAAIAGALVGARSGMSGIPQQWLDTVQGCDTTAGSHPRQQYQEMIRSISGLAESLLAMQ